MNDKTSINSSRINHTSGYGHLSSGGFSLIEMMLAMLIGAIILAGIFTVFANTRESQRTMTQHLQMLGDARFSIELLTYDLRHASIYGGTNLATLVECRAEDSSCSVTAPANDCATGWSHDIDLPLYSPLDDDEVATYVTNGCPITSHVAGTDVIVIRYADAAAIDAADLEAGNTYVRSNYKSGRLFVGATEPGFSGDTLDSFTNNYKMVTRAYYISAYTDTVGDGIPSLRRLELEEGTGTDADTPVLTDQVLMSGVENLQIQFGIDTNNDGEINKYTNAENVSAESVTNADDGIRAQAKTDWSKVKAVKVWALVRAEKPEKDFNTASADGNGYSLGGFTIPDGDLNDGYRRLLLSNVIRMRNMDYDALAVTTPVSP